MPSFVPSPPYDGFPEIPGDPPVLGILASGSGSNFETIANCVERGDLEADISCLVCNNPGARCLDRAERLGVPSTVINHRDYDDRSEFDVEIVEHLKSRDVEWVVMAGWMRIVTSTFIDAYRERIVNLHPSILPAFRGVQAVDDALEAGVKMTGCTVHTVTEEVDAGPIIAQAAVPVRADDDHDSLIERIHEAEHWIFPRAIADAVAQTRTKT
mgnify:CR=1 FL=1